VLNHFDKTSLKGKQQYFIKLGKVKNLISLRRRNQ